VRVNPAIAGAPTYPLSRVGSALIDLSLGQPCDPIAPFLHEALVAAIAATPFDSYPLSQGVAELRAAIAGWAQRRFGAALDPDAEVLPTLGSKEPIAVLARVLARPGDAVAVPTPAYPVPERSARFAGLDVVEVPLSAAGGWLPDPDAIPWGERLAIVWLGTPHNPTGAVAPPELVAELAERCRRCGAILAVDEAYSELWFDGAAPPGSALALEDRTGVAVFNTLSKRSGVPGLRSGFVAGDAEIVRRLERVRVDMGTTPQLFVQRASIAAWEDEAHVEEARERYAARRAALLDGMAAAGLVHAGGPAGMFLWLRVPDGDDEACFARLAARGVLVVPGSWLGPGGAGHLRASIARPVEELERVGELLA
jgi:aspartate/methionine/tyrosine aminotransferase